jgi:hypothetical protein
LVGGDGATGLPPLDDINIQTQLIGNTVEQALIPFIRVVWGTEVTGDFNLRSGVTFLEEPRFGALMIVAANCSAATSAKSSALVSIRRLVTFSGQ